MKEILTNFLSNDLLYQVLSLILTPVLGFLLVMYRNTRKKLLDSLDSKIKETPNKYDDVIIKIISDFVQESSGIESGNSTIKEAVENITNKLQNKVSSEIKDVSNEVVEQKVMAIAEKLLGNVEKEIHAADVFGNTTYTDNYKVTEIINANKELLKKDVNGYITGYAEAQAKISDTEKFAQGIVGVSATKTF